VSGLGNRPRMLLVFGAGGQAREAAWFARTRWGCDLDVRFVVDEARFLPDDPALGVGLLADVQPEEGGQWVAAVGDISTRRRAVQYLAATGMPAAQVVHTSVDLSAVEHLGTDVIISAGAVLSVGVVIQDHVHINVGTTVSHDVVVGAYATLSPGVSVAGWVDIQPGAFLGTGARIINGTPGRRLVIGEEAVVAAGACVLGPIEPGSMYAGVPARRKR
jgi:sugar O-acyltransferase (sialic acid O-acetyltransferase NeuD family)